MGLGSNTYAAATITRSVKDLFEPYQIFLDTKETVIELDSTMVEAFQSYYHLDDMSGYLMIRDAHTH